MDRAARLVRTYYLGTPLFLILDLLGKVNIRVAALEGRPGLRLAYYALCAGCAFVTWRRPGWAAVWERNSHVRRCGAQLLS